MGEEATARWPKQGHGPFLKDCLIAFSLIVIRIFMAAKNRPSFAKAASIPSAHAFQRTEKGRVGLFVFVEVEYAYGYVLHVYGAIIVDVGVGIPVW